MSYIALYRKFRPQTFDEVCGQDHIVTTLKNQIRAGRIGHAYLFVGTRGTGKTSVAKIFARAVNCESPQNGSPCGECAFCRAMKSGAALNIVELDAAANNGVDGVRQIIEEIDYSPTIGRYRVYIIDEVHMFTGAAFNALLKTLEEPPAHVIFILATTEVQTIPVTILSRCQRYDFHRIPMDDIVARLREVAERENIRATDEAFSYIARAADGAMRDGLSLLDQCAAFHYGEELTLDMVLDVLGAVEVEVYGALFDALLSGDVASALERVAKAVAEGRDLVQFVNDFIWYLRNLMLIKAAGDATHLAEVSTENRKVLSEKAKRIDLDVLLRYIRIFSELSGQVRYSMQKRILVEVAIIRLLRPQTEDGDEELAARVRALEDRSDRGEKKLENALTRLESGELGVRAAGGVQTPERAGAHAGDAVRDAKMEKLARALPDEVRQLAERREEILRRLTSPMREMLETAQWLIREDGTLTIAGAGLDIPGMMARDEGRHEKELRQVIEGIIGKEVPLQYTVLQNSEDSGQLFSVEEILQKGIHAESIELDDSDDQGGGR